MDNCHGINKEMKHIKVKRLKTKLLTNEEIELLLKLYNKAMNGKLKYVKKHCFNMDSVLDAFNDSDNVNQLDLQIINKIIIICKIMCSNGFTIADDIPYDLAMNKYKEYRDEPIIEKLLVSRRTHDKEHEFPELKGTLNKVQKVYKKDIQNKNERDLETFIRTCFEFATDLPVKFKVSNKYDGNSVVLSVKNHKVQSAITRGEAGKGADLMHLFKDKVIYDDGKYRGIKFEIVMTQENFISYCEDKRVKYDNLRTAVTSILTSTDAVKYAKYLTLVPLETSDNISEKMLNQYYSEDVDYVYTRFITNGPLEALEIIDGFIKKAIDARDSLNYAIDGLVIECLDKNVKKELGRKNDINQYQIAFKFPPQVRYTKVTKLKFTVGRTGIIIPMVYYEEIFFNGGRHTHSSISSYDRFKKLNLRVGDIIMVTYNGDVMPYVSKYNCKENDENNNSYLKYPKNCLCGFELEKTGANYYCNNPLCSSKKISAISHLYTTLGIRDMKEKNVEKLLDNKIITGLEDALRPNYKAMFDIEGYKEKSIRNFKEQISKAEDTKIDEAKLMKALGVSGERMARAILSVIPLDVILADKSKLYEADIEGVKDLTKDNFCKKLFISKHIIEKVRKQLIVKEVKVNHDKVMICFTGFRDKKLKELLELAGFEVVDNYKKKVSYVLIKEKGHESSTTKKAMKDNKQILTLVEFKNTILKDMEIDM